MIALVLAAFLVGFAIGGLLRRVETMAARRNARKWRWSSQRWQAEAADAYHEAADAWDEGWQNGVGIRVDLGEVEP